jgi:hypothetical protein
MFRVFLENIEAGYFASRTGRIRNTRFVFGDIYNEREMACQRMLRLPLDSVWWRHMLPLVVGYRQASTPRMSIGRNNVGRLQFSSASHLVVCHIHDISDRSIARFSTPYLFRSSCSRSNDRQIIINTELAHDFATPVIPDTLLYIACPCDCHSAFMNMPWVRPSTALTHRKGMGIIPCAGIRCPGALY